MSLGQVPSNSNMEKYQGLLLRAADLDSSQPKTTLLEVSTQDTQEALELMGLTNSDVLDSVTLTDSRNNGQQTYILVQDQDLLSGFQNSGLNWQNRSYTLGDVSLGDASSLQDYLNASVGTSIQSGQEASNFSGALTASQLEQVDGFQTGHFMGGRDNTMNAEAFRLGTAFHKMNFSINGGQTQNNPYFYNGVVHIDTNAKTITSSDPEGLSLANFANTPVPPPGSPPPTNPVPPPGSPPPSSGVNGIEMPDFFRYFQTVSSGIGNTVPAPQPGSPPPSTSTSQSVVPPRPPAFGNQSLQMMVMYQLLSLLSSNGSVPSGMDNNSQNAFQISL